MYCTDSWFIHSIYSTEISNLQSFLSSFHSFLHSSLFFSYGHSVFSSSLNRTDKNWYCLITNPNFFFELLSFFVFSHFLVDFHRISLIFLSYISQKTQKSKVSSHLDSNTADSPSLKNKRRVKEQKLCPISTASPHFGMYEVRIMCH